MGPVESLRVIDDSEGLGRNREGLGGPLGPNSRPGRPFLEGPDASHCVHGRRKPPQYLETRWKLRRERRRDMAVWDLGPHTQRFVTPEGCY